MGERNVHGGNEDSGFERRGCEKHIIARWIEKEEGEVKFNDIKQSGFIVVKGMLKSQMEKVLRVTLLEGGMDMYLVVFHLAQKLQ